MVQINSLSTFDERHGIVQVSNLKSGIDVSAWLSIASAHSSRIVQQDYVFGALKVPGDVDVELIDRKVELDCPFIQLSFFAHQGKQATNPAIDK